VKSGRRKSSKGLEAFMKQFPAAVPIIITIDNFQLFSADPKKFLASL